MRNPAAMYAFEDLEYGLTANNLEQYKGHITSILSAKNLLGDQKKDALADAALKTQPYPKISKQAEQAILDGRICLLSEGPAPYHPRYVAPYYDRLLSYGSAFLSLQPAEDLYQAMASLLAAYQYLPSGGLPVFIGRLDELFEPYIDSCSEQEAYSILRSFWLLVDRLFPNAFVHANLGPHKTKTGKMLLEIDRELKTITNLTFRYDPNQTERAYALTVVRNAMELAKPYFLNHPMVIQDWGPDYAVASCYNVMCMGGGIFTLVRLNLKEIVNQSNCSINQLMDEVIPEAAELQLEIINRRIQFLVEEIGWFENNIFVEEGLLDRNKFSAYAGVYGLAEAVEICMTRNNRPGAKYGYDPEANEVAEQIVRRLAEEIGKLPAEYCKGSNDRACFHAQVGISSDIGVTPGVRIPSGSEPSLYEHIQCEAPLHKYIPGGVSTILEFDQTVMDNLDAVLDIISGAFRSGIRNLSVGSKTSEFIRVSGYLMRRSDLEAERAEKALRHDSSMLGVEVFQNRPHALKRRVREV